MILSKKEMFQIFKYTRDIEIEIAVDDKVSEVLNRQPKYPKTTLQEKYNDYNSRLIKNPNSTRNKVNFNYIKYLSLVKNIVIVPEIIDEIVTDIITRNTQKKEKGSIAGIYGYIDTKIGKFTYIGKDSNIHINLRHNQHMTTGNLHIDKILQNDTEGRYKYEVLEIMENPTVRELDDAERYWIKFHNTYHYENPEGMNFTKGGETTYGIETEAKIDYNKVTSKINIYKGGQDGIKKTKRTKKGGEGTYYISTNGTYADGTYEICLNTPNCSHEKQGRLINVVLDYFHENYPDKTIKPTKAFERNIGNFDEIHNLYLENKLDKQMYNKFD